MKPYLLRARKISNVTFNKLHPNENRKNWTTDFIMSNPDLEDVELKLSALEEAEAADTELNKIKRKNKIAKDIAIEGINKEDLFEALIKSVFLKDNDMLNLLKEKVRVVYGKTPKQ